jgi:hypothetical protein
MSSPHLASVRLQRSLLPTRRRRPGTQESEDLTLSPWADFTRATAMSLVRRPTKQPRAWHDGSGETAGAPVSRLTDRSHARR